MRRRRRGSPSRSYWTASSRAPCGAPRDGQRNRFRDHPHPDVPPRSGRASGVRQDLPCTAGNPFGVNQNHFVKSHALGNDYIVVDPQELSFSLTERAIQRICDRHVGVGSDGILALSPSSRADFGLRIFNPDGSEAEKSGNGLRIFARYLHATGKTKKKRFTVETKGGLVSIELQMDRHGDASAATVEM